MSNLSIMKILDVGVGKPEFDVRLRLALVLKLMAFGAKLLL